MIDIRKARSPEDIKEAKLLIGEFFNFVLERYPEREEQLNEYMAEQNMDKQIAEFTSYFGPPRGECLLATHKDVVVGTVMLRRLDEELCEMNRMFVRPNARGLGAGRQLCQALVTEARALGFSQVRLDAWEKHWEALPLYESIGFTPEPENPDSDPLRVRLRMNLQETEA